MGSKLYLGLRSCSSITTQDINRIFRIKINEKIKQVEEIEPLICSYYDQPSTRTYLSFSIASQTLHLMHFDLARSNSRLLSGALLDDELQSIAQIHKTIFIIRSSKLDLQYYRPELQIINAGDLHEHPSQALTDVYTIFKYFNCNNIEALPDLVLSFVVWKDSLLRPLISIIKLLKALRVKIKIQIVGQLSSANMQLIESCVSSIKYLIHSQANIVKAFLVSDFVYILPPYVKGMLSFEIGKIDFSFLKKTRKIKAKILHPFPRTRNELPDWIDETEYNLYFEQMNNSVKIKCGILEWLIS